MFSIIADVLVFTSIVDDTAQNSAMKRKTTREKKKEFSPLFTQNVFTGVHNTNGIHHWNVTPYFRKGVNKANFDPWPWEDSIWAATSVITQGNL